MVVVVTEKPSRKKIRNNRRCKKEPEIGHREGNGDRGRKEEMRLVLSTHQKLLPLSTHPQSNPIPQSQNLTLESTTPATLGYNQPGQ